jgi:hypothetical protein
LAIITPIVTFLAGALPVVVNWLRDNGRDKRAAGA